MKMVSQIPPIKKINEILFGLADPDTIRKIATVKVTTAELYDKDGFPVEGGLVDTRMGVIDPGLRCRTCGKRYGECPGHFGYIELARPVIHVLFAEKIYEILNIVCHECGRVKLPEDKKEKFRKKLEKYFKLKEADKIKMFVKKKVLKEAKKYKECPHCNAKSKKIVFQKPYKFYIKEGNDLRRLTPINIRAIFEKIPDEELIFLGLAPGKVRPEWMILTVLPVPPVTVRPSIILESGERSEDDLTHKLADIIRTNQRLQEAISTGTPEIVVEDLWDLLQYHVATYFNNNLSGVPKARHRSGRPLKSLVERLYGKEGRLRQNLLGKRVNFSARAVISPDVRINVDEVGVPLEVAKELTIPERVTDWNLERMKKLILNGPDKYPGANYVIKPDGKRFRITEENKEILANDIQPGWIVERHLMDGDPILFNRHPSIHRMSIMSHSVRIIPGKTFRIHPASCPPYNADFDGDEMNIHVPQTEEARTEARLLLNVRYHIVTPRYGLPIVGTTQDATAGLYLLTRRGVKIPIKVAVQLLYDSGLEEFSRLKEFIERAKKEKREYLTGKEIFSVTLPKDLNFEHTDKKTGKKFIIRNGELIEGEITSGITGSEKGVLLRYLYEIYGPDFAINWLNIIYRLGSIYLARNGLTISPADWDLPEEAHKEIEKIRENMVKELKELISKYKEGKIQTYPGKTLKETFDIEIMRILNNGKNEIQNVISKYVRKDTGTYILSTAGVKGKLLNLVQIIAEVGLQALRGRPIEFGYKNRNLTIFKKGELMANARGWVSRGFRQGLKPWELFFAALPGRDALMDTAIRTAKSGYLYRRLVNAMYDLYVDYDGTVRDGSKKIIQFLYGEDGLDVQKTEHGKLNIERILENIKPEINNEKSKGVKNKRKTAKRKKR